MPSAQVIDLNPNPRTETTPLEKTLSAFSIRARQNQLENRENDALSDIYRKYQDDGRLLENTLRDIQTRPGISPSKRVQTINELLKMQQINGQLQEQERKSRDTILKQQISEEKTRKDEEQKFAEKQRAREALEASKATEQQKSLFEIAPVGAQTKIIEDVLEQKNREVKPAFISEEVEDYDRGLTPKERVKRQDARFSAQTPLVNKNSESLTALENEQLSLNLLDELTDAGKVGSGLQKLNIYPKTGDLIIPQLATPEEQLFVKTVNDFTVKAKDSFGARVTNFELDRFMQRLPTLANSTEGRKLILRQMQIVNQINQMEKKAIQGVFDQYGVRNIDYVDAENKARAKIKDQKEALRKEYLGLEQLAKKEDAELVANIKDKALPGYVPLRKPDGTIKQFPEKNLQNLLEKGYKTL